MEKFNLTVPIRENQRILDDVGMLTFESESVAKSALPGQFLMIQAQTPGAPLFKKPFGIARVKGNDISFLYRIVGSTTNLLSQLKAGDNLTVLGPLGHGFTKEEGKTLIVGGGMGLAPLYFLAQSLPDTDVLMGARSAKELFWSTLYKSEQGVKNIFLTTDDGSCGTQGTVMALLPGLIEKTGYKRVYVCGPRPMMQAVRDFLVAQRIPTEVSLERHMACGIGACLSCACNSTTGRVKVCKNGPVFNANEVTEC